jgi:hypothetical protein
MPAHPAKLRKIRSSVHRKNILVVFIDIILSLYAWAAFLINFSTIGQVPVAQGANPIAAQDRQIFATIYKM